MVDLSGALPPISVDTNVIGVVAGRSDLGAAYRELLQDAAVVVTYFVQAEIQVREWHPNERPRMNELLSTARFLLPPGSDVIDHYVDLKRAAIALGLRYGAEREDLWMLAQTRHERLPVMTHDRNAARVARSLGMQVVTALPDIEDDYARDRRRLTRGELT